MDKRGANRTEGIAKTFSDAECLTLEISSTSPKL